MVKPHAGGKTLSSWVLCWTTCHRDAVAGNDWFLLPTSKTKNVTSNIPCSFSNSLEICHPLTSFISFWSYFYFYWTGASCVMSSTILQLVTWSCHLGALRWLDSPPGSTHTFLNLPHFSLGIFGRTKVTKKWLLATPLTHVPYIYGALFCPSLLFDPDNFIYRIILGLCSTCRIQINKYTFR